MRKIFILIIVSLLLTGCSNAPKHEPTPTATPEPSAKETTEITVKEGYYIILEEGKEFTFEQFIEDQLSYNFSTPEQLCNYLNENVESFFNYQKSNGEIEISAEYFGPNSSILEPIQDDISFLVENTNKWCPAEIEKVENYTE